MAQVGAGCIRQAAGVDRRQQLDDRRRAIEPGQRGNRRFAILTRDAGPDQNRSVDRRKLRIVGRAIDGQQLRRRQPIELISNDPRRFVEKHDRLRTDCGAVLMPGRMLVGGVVIGVIVFRMLVLRHRGQRMAKRSFDGAERFVERVVEPMVHVVVQHVERCFDRLGRLEEAAAPNRFQPHAGVRIVHPLVHQFKRMRHALAPLAKHAHGGGAGPELGRIEQSFEQRFIDDVVRLIEPQRFEQQMLVIVARRIEPGDPCLRAPPSRRPCLARPVRACAVTSAVFGLFKQFEQRGDRLAGDVRRIDERAILVTHAPDAAVRVIAERLAQVVLQVADQGVVPVDDVQGAVGAELQIDRTEVAMLAEHQRADFLAAEAGAVFANRVLQHGQIADHVADQKIALHFRREVAAGDELAARGRPDALQEGTADTAGCSSSRPSRDVRCANRPGVCRGIRRGR